MASAAGCLAQSTRLMRLPSGKARRLTGRLTDADLIVVEVANVRDDAAMASAFAGMSRSAAQPPLSARIPPGLQAALAARLRETGMDDTQFADIETWAAALMLARNARSGLSPKHGIDKAVLDAAPGKKVEELEGVNAQLAMFDGLPETEQRDLLAAVVRDGGDAGQDSAALAKAWRLGDMQAIETETRRGVLADPQLREAMFGRRNRAWTLRITALLESGKRPFIAVGAAHMAGSDGLVALLQARGWTVKRVQ